MTERLRRNFISQVKSFPVIHRSNPKLKKMKSVIAILLIVLVSFAMTKPAARKMQKIQ